MTISPLVIFLGIVLFAAILGSAPALFLLSILERPGRQFSRSEYDDAATSPGICGRFLRLTSVCLIYDIIGWLIATSTHDLGLGQESIESYYLLFALQIAYSLTVFIVAAFAGQGIRYRVATRYKLLFWMISLVHAVAGFFYFYLIAKSR